LGITIDDLTRAGQVVQIGAKPNRIGLLTSISGVRFDEAWTNKAPGSIDGVPVYFIGRLDLIRNKESTGRPRDRSDVEALRQRELPD
jgi:hypothetical protein